MVRVFVTGGSGFIGGRLIDRLVTDGHQVRALVRSDAAAARVRARGAEPVPGDIGDVDAVQAAADGCAWCFHAAANVRDWGDPLEFERDNVTGTRNVLRACARAGVRRFVHVGTEAAILHGRPVLDADETAPLRPHSRVLYCSSKARAEQFVLDADRDGFETVVIRPRFVWGPGDTTILQGMVDRVRRRRFAWIGGGRHLTSTAHVDNLVEALLLAASHPAAPGNAYFVTDGEPVTYRDFVGDLLRTQGVEPPELNIPRPIAAAVAGLAETAWRVLPVPGRPPLSRFHYWIGAIDCTLDDTKIREQLGYRPVMTPARGLAELRAASAAA